MYQNDHLKWKSKFLLIQTLLMVVKGLKQCRVCADLEKSLNLTLVLENSWNLKKVLFVQELSGNFVKSSLKI